MKHYKAADSFKSRIADCHGRWLEKVIGIPYVGRAGNGGGIDLLSDKIGIELKCRLRKYSCIWACDENDKISFEERHQDIALYWAFLLYEISRGVQDLRKIRNLDRFVVSRECWFLPWKWIEIFPVYSPEKSGPFRYANARYFPPAEEFEEKCISSGERIFVPKEDKEIFINLMNS